MCGYGLAASGSCSMTGLCPRPNDPFLMLLLSDEASQHHSKVTKTRATELELTGKYEKCTQGFPYQTHFHLFELFLSLDSWSHACPSFRWQSEKTWRRMIILLLNGPWMRTIWKNLFQGQSNLSRCTNYKIIYNYYYSRMLHFACPYDMIEMIEGLPVAKTWDG